MSPFGKKTCAASALVYVSARISSGSCSGVTPTGSGRFPFPHDSATEEVAIGPLWAPIRDSDVRLARLRPASARKLELASGRWEDGGLREDDSVFTELFLLFLCLFNTFSVFLPAVLVTLAAAR